MPGQLLEKGMTDPCPRCGYDPVGARKKCPACLTVRSGPPPPRYSAPRVRGEPSHGTLTCWAYGCRCECCRACRRRYDQRRRGRSDD
jgi:hypothetical protein